MTEKYLTMEEYYRRCMPLTRRLFMLARLEQNRRRPQPPHDLASDPKFRIGARLKIRLPDER